MRVERIVPGEPVDPARLIRLADAVLTRDLEVDGVRWRKGRRLSTDDVLRLAAEPGYPVTLLVLGAGDLHEDDAAVRLATAVAGTGVVRRGPSESRVDLLAAHDGVLRVRVAALERVDRIDPLAVFSRFDGQVVAAGDPVAAIKIAPQAVDGALVDHAVAICGTRGLVSVAPYRPTVVGVLVKEALHAPARERFESSVRTKVEALGSTVGPIRYVTDDVPAVGRALDEMTRGPTGMRLVLSAGSSTSDPLDACFTAIESLGGRLVRQGAPAHPGSMLWLARVGRTSILGLPTCGAFSMATAADLLLPWLLAGAPPTRTTVARLGHGGLLLRDQRFRFPAYARGLDAPEG
jgi:hypothetical protein